jgi:hypothetical protein
MDIRQNLRELFVAHSFDRPIEAEDPPPDGTCEVMGFGERTQPWIMFKKPEGSTVFMIGEEGENILAVSKPPRVIVPLAQYSARRITDECPQGEDDPHQLECAIQDRLQAILDSVALHAISGFEVLPGESHPVVKPDQMVAFLRERLGKPLKALVANAKTAELIGAHDYAGHLPVYDYRGLNTPTSRSAMPDGLVYGLPEPKFVGHIIEAPGPALVGGKYVGIMCHGRVPAARIKLANEHATVTV